jgi:hypothetical protein
MVESQYDAYLRTVRGLSRSTRSLHRHVVHRLLSWRFPIGYIRWSEIRFNDFAQFLTSEVARLRTRWTQTTWLMVLAACCAICLARATYLRAGRPRYRQLPLANTFLRLGDSHRNRCGRFGQPVRAESPATFVTGRSCWFSCVSDCALKRSRTSHSQISIGGADV